METRKLGSLEVSVVGVGCNHIGVTVDEAGAAAIVNAALESGVTFFDMADEYGMGRAEELIGKAVRGRRDRVTIATMGKMPPPSPLPNTKMSNVTPQYSDTNIHPIRPRHCKISSKIKKAPVQSQTTQMRNQ